jgi:hypothetical protein
MAVHPLRFDAERRYVGECRRLDPANDRIEGQSAPAVDDRALAMADRNRADMLSSQS